MIRITKLGKPLFAPGTAYLYNGGEWVLVVREEGIVDKSVAVQFGSLVDYPKLKSTHWGNLEDYKNKVKNETFVRAPQYDMDPSKFK